jgi:hypothetical protein
MNISLNELSVGQLAKDFVMLFSNFIRTFYVVLRDEFLRVKYLRIKLNLLVLGLKGAMLISTLF